MKKACFIIVNFGKAPPWKNLFMHSCAKNSDYDWIIYTDKPNSWYKGEFNVPSNIWIKKIEIEEFKELCMSTIGMCPKVESKKVKVCDVRPLFGLIFEKDLSMYKYIGNSDTDIIWGDMQKFLGEVIDKEYDIISSRLNILAGHCTLYKNKSEVFKYCLNSGPFRPLSGNIKDKEYLTLKEIIEDEIHHSFDEPIYSSKLRTKKAKETLSIHWPQDLSNYTPDYIKIIMQSNDKRKGIMRKECSWTYQDGKTFLDNYGEILYIHFMNWKNIIKDPDFSLNNFKLNKNGIIKC
jgi:hypothetical protein